MTSSQSPPNGIVYFHYTQSPYARRVGWYLALRQIAHAECIQPMIMPRPDLSALGVQYRRTPTMAVGRDIYLDSRLILQKLETLFPSSPQHPALSTPETAGLAALLDKFATDASLFSAAVNLISWDASMPGMKELAQDRAGFFPKAWVEDDPGCKRKEGVVRVRQSFGILESFFVDGRGWIGGTGRPSLADLEAIWCVDWVIAHLSPPQEYFSDKIYPKVYDWHKRFMQELEAAKAKAPKPVTLEGADAVKAVLSSDFVDKDLSIDKSDPAYIAEGTNVQVFPTDSGGFTHKDEGKLVKLTKDEVAIAVQSEKEGVEVHVHAPRWNFRIIETGGSRL